MHRMRPSPQHQSWEREGLYYIRKSLDTGVLQLSCRQTQFCGGSTWAAGLSIRTQGERVTLRDQEWINHLETRKEARNPGEFQTLVSLHFQKKKKNW